MREQIAHLSREQSMFLLTLMMLEGEADLELLRYLPQEQSQSIEPAGRNLCAEPRKQVLPEVVREIKRLLKESQRSPFEQYDPEWMAEYMIDESPRVISALLQQFPRATADRVLMALPGHLRQRIPQAQYPLHPEIARLVKQKFDARCPATLQTSSPTTPAQLSLESLPHLQTEELMQLIRELGLRELAVAFRAAGSGPLTELCRRLEPRDAERLLSIIKSITTPVNSQEAKSEMKSATRVIQSVSRRGRSKEQLIEDAGLAKLREASLELTEEDQYTIALALPRRIGVQFRESRGLDIRPQEKYRIQCDAIQTIMQLSQEGLISQQWSQLEANFPPAPPEEQFEAPAE